MQKTIRIGTRKSKLALVQTHMVEKMILEAFPDLKIEICEMSTKGDELLDRSLLSFGGKGVFTQELEAALLQGQIDLAVHSAKDMPMEFPEGLGIGAVLRRGPVEDVIVTKDGTLLKDLKPGSVVGTGSLRRELQIKMPLCWRQQVLTGWNCLMKISGNLSIYLQKSVFRQLVRQSWQWRAAMEI